MRSIERHVVEPRIATPRTSSRALGTLAVAALASGLVSCGSLDPVAPYEIPITDPAQLYTSLTLNHAAVTLSTSAPYNTLPLAVTPRNALGEPMSGFSAPVYVSGDTTNVQVTPDGVLIGRGPATRVRVTASLVVGRVQHDVTIFVNVNDVATTPRLASLSIQPIPPDSAVMALRAGNNSGGIASSSGLAPIVQLVPVAVDSDGNAVPNLAFAYTSLDPAVTEVADGFVNLGFTTGYRPGQARLVVETTAYGITKADTVTYTVTLPLAQELNVMKDPLTGKVGFYTLLSPRSGEFSPAKDIRIMPHGIVLWYNDTSTPVDVVFDDSTAVAAPASEICGTMIDFFIGVDNGGCGAGNILIPAFPDDNTQTFQLRQFPEPGIYPFRSAATGTSGRIIVSGDPNVP